MIIESHQERSGVDAIQPSAAVVTAVADDAVALDPPRDVQSRLEFPKDQGRRVRAQIAAKLSDWTRALAAGSSSDEAAPVTVASQGQQLLSVWKRTWSKYKPRHEQALAVSNPIVKDSGRFMADLSGLGKLWWLRGGHYGPSISLNVARRQAQGVLEKHFLEQAPRAQAAFDGYIARLIEWRGEKGFPNRTRRMIRDALREASLLRPSEVAGYFAGLLPSAEMERIRAFRENDQERLLSSFMDGARALIAERARLHSGPAPYNVVAVGLTGSYVYGTATPESDLDLAVITRDGTGADVDAFMAELAVLAKERGWPYWKDWSRHRNIFPASRLVIERVYDGLPRRIVSPYPEIVEQLGGEKVMTEFWKPGSLVESLFPGFDAVKRAALGVVIRHWEHSARAPVRDGLEEYSDWLSILQRRLKQRYGITRVYVGGGSSLSVLDHLFGGAPLRMRDFDIFVDAGRPVDADLLADMGRVINDEALGRFSVADIRPRPRANPALTGPARYAYNAGYGSFWFKGDKTLDLSVFHSGDDMRLNGAFDIERIMIPLEAGTDLRSWVRSHARLSYEDLVARGAVLDPDGGYPRWRAKTPRLVRPEKIRSDPATEIIRIARTYSRLGFSELPADVIAQIRAQSSRGRASIPLQAARNLLKLLGDPNAAITLKMLAAVDGAGILPPALNARIIALPASELAAVLDPVDPGNPSRAPPAELERLDALLERLSPAERLPLLTMMNEIQPAWAARRSAAILDGLLLDYIGHGLPQNSKAADVAELMADKTVTQRLGVEVSRIVQSRVLSRRRKGDLLIRAVLRRLPVNDRFAALTELAPGLTGSESRRLLSLARRRREGFMTGVFNPFHHGHRDTVRHAVEQMALDEIVVMPTPKTNHNETPIAWELRLDMAKAGLRDLSEATVIGRDYAAAFERGGTGRAVLELKSRAGDDVDWVHVMGADSFQRRARRGYSGPTFNERNEIFVMARPAHHLEIAPEYRDWVHLFGADVLEFAESARSSTLVRALREDGGPISGLVPAGVEDYIEEHGLYAGTAARAVR